MRAFGRLAALTAASASAGLLLISAGGVASASESPAASVHLTGGHTTVSTAPGIVAALVKNSIIPLAVSPGRQRLVLAPLKEHFKFPVDGGKVSLSPLMGSIRHHGGILFLNAKTGKEIEVSRFTIHLKHADLTAIVNGDSKVRVPVFRLNLSKAVLKSGKHFVTASDIGLTLTKVAAKALNASLGTTLFSQGLAFGTASTVVRF